MIVSNLENKHLQGVLTNKKVARKIYEILNFNNNKIVKFSFISVVAFFVGISLTADDCICRDLFNSTRIVFAGISLTAHDCILCYSYDLASLKLNFVSFLRIINVVYKARGRKI
uniref:Uncharacterized protein n=1 Tax=Cacopsylla melanoneura TaxID=428564 RepID=A0A8D8LQ95_9HEMI